VNGLGSIWFHRMDLPLAFEPAIAKLDALPASTDAAGLGLNRAPG
jgi:hypothetical protein